MEYLVRKRGKEMGPFVPNEIVDLLRMRELNTMCSVQIENEWVSISEFLNRHEKGELTVAKLAKKTEPEESKVKVSKKQKPSKNPKKAPVPEVKSSPKAAPPPVVIPKITPHTEIIVVRDGQQHGPYLHRELIDYLKAGHVSLTDKCWIDGVSDWVSISQIPNITDGINSLGAAAPPPPKPPPVVRPPLDFNDEEENDEDRQARSAPSDEYMKMLGLDRPKPITGQVQEAGVQDEDKRVGQLATAFGCTLTGIILLAIVCYIFTVLSDADLKIGLIVFVILAVLWSYIAYLVFQNDKRAREESRSLERRQKNITVTCPNIIKKLSKDGFSSLNSVEKEVLFQLTEQLATNAHNLHENEIKALQVACSDQATYNIIEMRNNQLSRMKQASAFANLKTIRNGIASAYFASDEYRDRNSED